MSSINQQLYRPIKSGYEYNGLIPAYKGVNHDFDSKANSSDTYDTLQFMSQWVMKYHNQMSQIAPLMKGRTVEETVTKIYKFLYNHFQYKLDENLQQLYSPSAAWHFRKTGFDCKTYSLLASCTLTELNIKHSFRKVQQNGIAPGQWSHVYVIVHDNGKDYVIDATNHTNTEVAYTKKYDFMLKHIGLAGAYQAPLPVMSNSFNGLGCSCSTQTPALNGWLDGNSEETENGSGSGMDLSFLKDWLKDIDIKNLLSSISGIFNNDNNSAFKASYRNQNLTDFLSFFTGLVNNVNLSKNAQNFTQLAIDVAHFNAAALLVQQTYIKKKASKDWNSYSDANFDVMIDMGNFYKQVGTAMYQWLFNFYSLEMLANGRPKPINSVIKSNEGFEQGTKYWGMWITPYTIGAGSVYKILSQKEATPDFILNKYLSETHKNKTYKLADYLKTLGVVGQIISPDGSTYTNNNGVITPTGKNTNNSTFTNVAAVAGIGTLAFFLFRPNLKTMMK